MNGDTTCLKARSSRPGELFTPKAVEREVFPPGSDVSGKKPFTRKHTRNPISPRNSETTRGPAQQIGVSIARSDRVHLLLAPPTGASIVVRSSAGVSRPEDRGVHCVVCSEVLRHRQGQRQYNSGIEAPVPSTKEYLQKQHKGGAISQVNIKYHPVSSRMTPPVEIPDCPLPDTLRQVLLP